MAGKIIVIEGACDGIGKSTQSKLLEQFLIENNIKVKFHHFPTYNSKQGALVEEYLKGKDSRWPAGLPASGDAQLLFMQSALNKLDENGRAAIIENGSPLFTGNTSSGESQIRRWLLENDYLEAIIAMPTDMFYNTGIATYIWILSKNKSANRKGKVQLIDASSIYTDLRKPLGNKRRRFAPQDREKILHLYTNFVENNLSQIHSNTDFIYREYTVMQPLQRSYGINKERLENLLQNKIIKNLYDEAKVQELESEDKLSAKDQKKLNKYQKNKPIYDKMLEILNNNISDKLYMSPEEFKPVITKLLGDTV